MSQSLNKILRALLENSANLGCDRYCLVPVLVFRHFGRHRTCVKPWHAWSSPSPNLKTHWLSLSSYPRLPQTPTRKEIPSETVGKGLLGIFQGYVGEILDLHSIQYSKQYLYLYIYSMMYICMRYNYPWWDPYLCVTFRFAVCINTKDQLLAHPRAARVQHKGL